MRSPVLIMLANLLELAKKSGHLGSAFSFKLQFENEADTIEAATECIKFNTANSNEIQFKVIGHSIIVKVSGY